MHGQNFHMLDPQRTLDLGKRWSWGLEDLWLKRVGVAVGAGAQKGWGECRVGAESWVGIRVQERWGWNWNSGWQKLGLEAGTRGHSEARLSSGSAPIM